MLVMILDVVPPSLRGEISRWLMPVDASVFVGRVSAEVRDHLWTSTVQRIGSGRAMQIWQAKGEQGFAIRGHNLAQRSLVEAEGLTLVAVQDAAWKQAVERFKLQISENQLNTP
jgi:CRISPR-associated protein Cas2